MPSTSSPCCRPAEPEWLTLPLAAITAAARGRTRGELEILMHRLLVACMDECPPTLDTEDPTPVHPDQCSELPKLLARFATLTDSDSSERATLAAWLDKHHSKWSPGEIDTVNHIKPK